MQNNVYNFYESDLPDDCIIGDSVAIDTETLGLNNFRDRLCLVQLYFGSGKVHIIHFNGDNKYDKSPNLKKLLTNDKILKIFHYARFDLSILQKTFKIDINNIYCTKIASKIARTYTDAHGLKAIVKEFLNIDISKKEQSSYWGGSISDEQLKYAANDVLFLHKIMDKLNYILENENRKELLEDCLKFLKTRVELDLRGWLDVDIFSHQ